MKKNSFGEQVINVEKSYDDTLGWGGGKRFGNGSGNTRNEGSAFGSVRMGTDNGSGDDDGTGFGDGHGNGSGEITGVSRG